MRRFLGGAPGDLFALGVLYYILVCGAHPFDLRGDATEEELGRRIRRCEWTFPAELYGNQGVKG